MIEKLIQQYINRMTDQDIDTFAKSYGITLKEEEIKLIYEYIKKDWRTIVYGNPRPILDELKKKLEPVVYNKMETLYIEFKQKYEHYL